MTVGVTPPPHHPDRMKWNARYRKAALVGMSFAAIPWLEEALHAAGSSPSPTLELACGPSGTALELAAAGIDVTAVDVSDVALDQLRKEALRRGVSPRLSVLHADLETWTPPADAAYALVICSYFWSARVFEQACLAVRPGGVLAWEAPVHSPTSHSHVPSRWCVSNTEPASLLPSGFALISQTDAIRSNERSRRMIARRNGEEVVLP